MPWNTTPAATALIAAINPADLIIVRRVRPIGPDYFAWSTENETCDALQLLREAEVTETTGATFATTDDRGAWLDAYNATSSVGDALNQRFGDPEAFAAAWGLYGRCDTAATLRMNDIWQAECARAAAVKVAA